MQSKVNELEKGEERKWTAFGGTCAYSQWQQWSADGKFEALGVLSDTWET